MSILEWYFPWDRVDWVLKIELLVWLSVIAASYWISWRTLVHKRPWLRGWRRKK